MEKIAGMIADFLTEKNDMTSEEREICRYGYEIVLSSIAGYLLVIGIAAVTGSLMECLVYLVVFVTMRLHCGGYHANTYQRCFLSMGCVFAVYLLILNWVQQIGIPVMAGMLLVSAAAVLLWAPVENKNKPLSKAEKKRERIISILLCFGYGTVEIASIVITGEVKCMITVTLFAVTVLIAIEKWKEAYQK